MIPHLKNTADGSQTLYLPDIDETYHSLSGAIGESKFVFIQNGYIFNSSDNPVVFEVGFGTGLNCLLTAREATNNKRPTFYISVEKFPLSKELLNRLNYGSLIGEDGIELYEKISFCKWGESVDITPWFKLLKIKADIINEIPEFPFSYDIIYYDAFAPDKQPEMWNAKIFSDFFFKTSENGVLVTYSAKGEVRRRLSSAGYKTERLPGFSGKREMLRAIKTDLKISLQKN